MQRLIVASLGNPHAVIVFMLTVVLLGGVCTLSIPVDILPVFRSPAVQVLTFYGGMPAGSMEKDITNRMERWTGQAAGTARQESRSIVGASIIRNYYRDDVNPNGALTQVNSLASAAIPNLPPGTLPPVILPFDPTGTVPTCLVALNSQEQDESTLYDVGRYEVRNMIMALPGAVAPVVYGGRIRAVMVYLDRIKMQARNLAPLDVMKALDDYNLFLPTGDAKFGDIDYAIDSNSMFRRVEDMGDIPLRTQHGNSAYLRDVARPADSSYIQTNIVRVNGRRQVYIPVYRQPGSSTLRVVNALRQAVPDMKPRLTRSGIDLKVVMDQSVYVRHSIESLVEEGLLGAVLCSLVVLLFLGEWRMTIVALMTIPIAILAAMICLYCTGNTLNVMTLAGLSLAIGPLVDVAIVCLENTHRHLGQGSNPRDAALFGSGEVSLPVFVACLATLLVLAPLALMPGMGQFLFKPMAMSVTAAMMAAFLLAMTLVPVQCAFWLRPHHFNALAQADEFDGRKRRVTMFERWERVIAAAIGWYTRRLSWVMAHRRTTVAAAVVLLAVTLAVFGTRLRREFFPEVDAGAFEMYVRAATATRVEETELRIAAVEDFLKRAIGDDLDAVISEIGVTPDWSAAYTPNSGPMDTVVKVQLTSNRRLSSQQHIERLRAGLRRDAEWSDLEFAFDAGGMIRGAMNEGKSMPINVRIESKDAPAAHQLAERIEGEVSKVPGIVDCRILQRLDYPQYVIEVDRGKAANLGLNQADVMRNVLAATNSSIQFNKRNFWIDPVSFNQYFVGVQYPEDAIQSMETLLDISITSPVQKKAVPLRNVAHARRVDVPAEVTHTNLQPTIDLTMNVFGRDLGHVADDVSQILARFGQSTGRDTWAPFDPVSGEPLAGSRILLSGEYQRMQDTFRNLGAGLLLATLLIYFLMVALFKSYVTPLVILFAVPIGLVGVVLMLYVTGSALNVQSLLGITFMIGIVVSNTVLMIDFAQNLRATDGLTPTEAVCRAAAIRVRPVVMTALAALFALLPMALAMARGSEANAPLGRAVIGGLLAGLLTTLFVVPALYSLVVRDDSELEHRDEPTQVEPGFPRAA
ncbi:MAG TPA: efflux RND transporter permease subunit [Pirellulales bacterium]|nr:efflux RND transporter permease subunit [Pirellulales bacterium]